MILKNQCCIDALCRFYGFQAGRATPCYPWLSFICGIRSENNIVKTNAENKN